MPNFKVRVKGIISTGTHADEKSHLVESSVQLQHTVSVGMALVLGPHKVSMAKKWCWDHVKAQWPARVLFRLFFQFKFNKHVNGMDRCPFPFYWLVGDLRIFLPCLSLNLFSRKASKSPGTDPCFTAPVGRSITIFHDFKTTAIG